MIRIAHYFVLINNRFLTTSDLSFVYGMFKALRNSLTIPPSATDTGLTREGGEGGGRGGFNQYNIRLIVDGLTESYHLNIHNIPQHHTRLIRPTHN